MVRRSKKWFAKVEVLWFLPRLSSLSTITLTMLLMGQSSRHTPVNNHLKYAYNARLQSFTTNRIYHDHLNFTPLGIWVFLNTNFHSNRIKHTDFNILPIRGRDGN